MSHRLIHNACLFWGGGAEKAGLSLEEMLPVRSEMRHFFWVKIKPNYQAAPDCGAAVKQLRYGNGAAGERVLHGVCPQRPRARRVRKAGVLLRAVSLPAATAPGGDYAAEFMAVVFGEAHGRCIVPAGDPLVAEDGPEKLENWLNRPVAKTTGRCFLAVEHTSFTEAFPGPFCPIATVCHAIF